MEFTGNSFAQRMVRRASERSRSNARATPSTTVSSGFEHAINHFAHGHWSDAFDELVRLADAGDPEAARIAMLMAVRGPRLFGRTFPASSSQRKRWHEVASRGYTA